MVLLNKANQTGAIDHRVTNLSNTATNCSFNDDNECELTRIASFTLIYFQRLYVTYHTSEPRFSICLIFKLLKTKLIKNDLRYVGTRWNTIYQQ